VRHTDELGFDDSRNEDEDRITRVPQSVFCLISQMEYHAPFEYLIHYI